MVGWPVLVSRIHNGLQYGVDLAYLHGFLGEWTMHCSGLGNLWCGLCGSGENVVDVALFHVVAATLEISAWVCCLPVFLRVPSQMLLLCYKSVLALFEVVLGLTIAKASVGANPFVCTHLMCHRCLCLLHLGGSIP